MNLKRFWALVLVLAMVLSLTTGMFASAEEPPEAAPAAETRAANDNLLRIWYDEPATDWQTGALAIGNGYMGGLVFGGVANDKIHLNEKTIWGGGPTKTNNYNYGNTNPTETEEDLQTIKDNLEAIREKLDDKSQYVFGFDEASYGLSGTNTTGPAMNELSSLMGDLNGYTSPVDYANIRLDFSKSGLTDAAAKNYIRDLDLRTGLATVSYDYDGVHYTREYFNSYPDNVLVIRLEANQDGKLTFDTSLAFAGSFYNSSNAADGDTITLRGSISNGLMTEGQLKVVNEGGTATANGNGSISVAGADAVTLILACGTDYKMELPAFRSGEDPHGAVTQRVQDAAKKGYAAVKADHVADHSDLFSRLELGFNEEIPQIPTDELIEKYRNMVDGDGSNPPTEAEQRALEVICYQFGRYLTIAGSREGALPTNLQGVWGEGSFAWGGDYHFNINVQMNYWPTMASNLGECLLPFNDYLEILRQAGRGAAAAAYGIKSGEGEENGWLVGCFSTPYMFATMGQKGNAAGWNPTGAAWALQNAYEYYQYTGDVAYLRDHLYPSMKEVANFWNEALWWSEYQQRYVSAPSYSPEQGPIVNGASYDQQFIWQHFENTIQAAEILGVDEDMVKAWKDKQSKLDPVLVGDDGQVKEWFEETGIGKAQAGDLEEINVPLWRASLGAGAVPHRHLSHLMAMYPGTLINKDNNEFMDAAIVSLNERGLDATGWSKAHKLNLWARTGNAENSFAIVQSAVGGGNSGFLTNLFSSHGGGTNYKGYPIFQIDGNFGYTAGVNEMLLQSQLGYTQFLPALPDEWSTGFVDGIVARGNFVIDMAWSGGIADRFAITSRNGGAFIGEYENLSAYTVKDSKGHVVQTSKLSDDKISFETVEGETYTINFNQTPAKLKDQIGLAKEVAASMTDTRLASAKTILEHEIETAQAIVDAEDVDQYYDGALAMSAARVRAEAAISLLANIVKSETFHAESVKKAEVWDAAMDAADNLAAEIRSATLLLSSADAGAKAFIAASGQLDGKRNAITELFDSIRVSIATTGGVLTMTPSDRQFEIRYTLDGNAPSVISKLYEEPVPLPKKTVTIRAALFIGDVQVSKEYSFAWNGGDLATSAAEVVASSNEGAVYKLFDGDPETYWFPDTAEELPGTVTLIYEKPITIDHAYVLGINYYGAYWTTSVAVDYWDADTGDWVELAAEPNFYPKLESSFSFDEVTTTKVRLRVLGSNVGYAVLAGFEISYSKAGGVVDMTDLKDLLAEAEALRSSDKYQNAGSEDRASFDRYYGLASAVAGNETSDPDTVKAATDALLDAMAILDGITPERALDILRVQLTEATVLADTLTGEGQEITRSILEDVISEAWEVKTQAQAEKYYTTARALKNAIARTGQAVKLVAQTSDAKALLETYTAKAGRWTAANERLDDLSAELAAAEEVLANATSAAKTLKLQLGKVSEAMAAVTNLFDSISLEITVTDGKAVMTASDEEFEIRYTLDGNTPSLISGIYEGPLELPNRALRIKAAAFVDDVQFGKVVTKSITGVNLALGKTAVSDVRDWGPGYEPSSAVDGDMETRWASRSRTASLTVDLGESHEICQVAVRQPAEYVRIQSFKIWVSPDGTDESWEEAYVEEAAAADAVYAFDPIDAQFVKLEATESSGEVTVSEFEVYAAAEIGEPADMTALQAAVAEAEAAKTGGVYEAAHDKMRARLDYYLDIAKEAVGNENSDPDTVKAAETALLGAVADLTKRLVTVNHGIGGGFYDEGETVVIQADEAPAGKRFDSWTVDCGGVELADPGSEKTAFTMPSEDVELTANYEKKPSGGHGGDSTIGGLTCTITVTQAEGGTITPSTTKVERGGSAVFTVKPNAGYAVKDVLVDGKSVGAVNSYTFSNVTASHTITAVFAAEKSAGFTDVRAGDWYADAVAWAVDEGVMNGTSATTFSPNAATTRGMIVTILYRLEGSPAASGASAFTDVTSGQYFADATAWAAANGIADGYGNGRFGPNNLLTREQLASILYRYAQYKKYDVTASADLSAYSDTADVSAYALPAIRWAVSEELINGTSGSALSPRASASRAQAAAILMRFSQKLAK